MDKPYANENISKKNGQAEITAEVPWETLEGYYNERLAKLRSNFEAPGFRKGNVPPEIFKAHIHEHAVLEDALEDALEEIYPELIAASELPVVGRPRVSVLKLAAGNPAEFKVEIGIAPEVKLPNYKKIAKEVFADIQVPEVTDAELEEVIATLRKLRAPAKEGEKEPELPELTDEFVKTLGAFENVEDFKTKLRKNMADEKNEDARAKARENLAAKLIEKSAMDLPELLLADEMTTVETQLLADLSQANLTFEDYLQKSGKTKEQVEKEHREYVERQLKMRFILEAVAKAEKIIPDEKDIEMEAEIMQQRYPNLEPVRIRAYVERLLTNEKTLAFLENGGEESQEKTA